MRPLITVSQLARLMEHAEFTLIDVRWSLGSASGHDEYRAGHIPGAVFVDLDTELAAPPGIGGRHPLPPVDVFAEALKKAGVTDHKQIVVYDGGSNLAAARLWWMLTDSGHRLVRVLNGGYARWISKGMPIDQGEVVATPGTFSPEPGHRPVATIADVIERLRNGGAVYDVRAADRYRGENETIDPVAGHIPGARNLPLSTLMNDGKFSPRGVLSSKMTQVRPGDVMSCGSGITAAAAILAAEQVGIGDLVLFAGSFSEWIANPKLPVAKGSDPGSLPKG